MKKILNWMLAAILLCGTLTVVTSCSLNDNPAAEEQQATVDVKALADQVWAYSQANPDGFTLNLATMQAPTEGISVAYAATQGSHSREQLETVIEHALAHGGFVGGWLDTTDGKYYFDSVRLFPEDQLDEATAFAIENEQLAFFIISTGTEVRLDQE